MQVLCKCYASAMRVLYKCYASPMQVLCKCYASAMQVLCNQTLKEAKRSQKSQNWRKKIKWNVEAWAELRSRLKMVWSLITFVTSCKYFMFLYAEGGLNKTESQIWDISIQCEQVRFWDSKNILHQIPNWRPRKGYAKGYKS